MLPDFQRVIISALPAGTGDWDVYREPYALCLHLCMDALVRARDHLASLPYLTAFGMDEKIACVCDRKPEVKGKAVETFNSLVANRKWEHVFDTITFASRHDFVPLQAADMLAYETFKLLKNRRNEPDRPQRKLLTRLIDDGERLNGGYLDAEAMEKWVAKMRADRKL